MEPMEEDDFGQAQSPFPSSSFFSRTPMSSRPMSPSGRSDVSDMDVDSPFSNEKGSNAVQMSPSVEQIHHMLGTSLSLKSPQGDIPQTCEAVKTGEINRKTWEPTLSTVVASSNFIKGKRPRYGLPDEEDLFSHYPEHAVKSVDSIRRRPNIKEKSTDCPKSLISDSSKKSEPSKKSGCRICGYILLMTIVGISIYTVVYVLDNQKRRCKLSREFDKESLKIDLRTMVFGQHIARSVIPDKIEAYFNQLNSHTKDSESSSISQKQCKPLVLSLHGSTGVGKNFVSRVIVEHFQLSLTNLFVVPFHFMHMEEQHLHAKQIQHWIMGNITDCMVNVVIVDEMDKASVGLVTGLINTVENLTQSCSTAPPTIFLLLSNSKSVDINQIFRDLHSSSLPRKEISNTYFKDLFGTDENQWFSSMGGENGLIDAFVPFLPLERRHVEQCIRRDLTAKKISSSSNVIEKVMKELNFFNVGDLELSATGCKRVTDKVNLVVMETRL